MKHAVAKSPEIDYQFLTAQLDAAKPGNIYQIVVSVPFENGVDMVLLFLGFICLYIVDEKKNKIQLVAASGTEEYRLAIEYIDFKLEEYVLDFKKNKDNTIVQAITSGKPKHTTDWATLNSGQNSTKSVRLNQANSGIAYTAIYPLQGPTRGALMFNYYQYPDGIGAAQEAFMKRYTKLVSSHLK